MSMRAKLFSCLVLSLALVSAPEPLGAQSFKWWQNDRFQQELALTDMGYAQVFAICNKVGDWLTGNLQGPLVVNAQNRIGQQIVLNDKKWTTRQPRLRLQAEVPLARSA